MRVKYGTKKWARYISAAKRFDGYQLSDAYANPSVYKQRAYSYYFQLCAQLAGSGFHICAHNAQRFSVAFMFYRECDSMYYWFYATGCNEYVIPMYHTYNPETGEVTE